MYAGRIVERGGVDDVLDRPAHPYTAGLIGSVPSRNQRGRPLQQIPGVMPSLLALPTGCSFRPRCAYADGACTEDPPLHDFAGGRQARCAHPLSGATP
jgi:peptide/nickel transport system ATP-binding protein